MVSVPSLPSGRQARAAGRNARGDEVGGQGKQEAGLPTRVRRRRRSIRRSPGSGVGARRPEYVGA
jgi:hypothetical protein